MQNVLIQTDGSRLKLAATDAEIAITTWIGGQIEGEGGITAPARLLTSFVNSLPAERIDLEIGESATGLALRCARVDANLNGIAADDFPPIPTTDEGVVGKIAASDLEKAITLVAFAAATEDSRPVLTGIKVEIEGDEATFAAADGFRLAVYKGKLAEPLSEDLGFIIPARALREISRLLAGRDEDVEFTVSASKNSALFRLSDTEIVTQLLQGAFPNYTQLIPQSFDTKATVTREHFSRATRTAAIFARDGSGIVRLQVVPGAGEVSAEEAVGRPGKVVISARAEEMGDHQDEVDTLVEGGESKIAFNSKYLLDVLSVMNLAEVALETSSPSSPGVFKPTDSDSYVHVVMPMFVQW
jgi:DNA polymerase-3 subunit beta